MNSYKEFKNHLPLELFEDEIFDKTMFSIGKELDRLGIDTKELEKQLNPQTCTWSINWWENSCSIKNNEDKSIEVRRSKVIAKLAQVSPLTKKSLENIIKTITKNEKAEIKEFYNKYMFQIKLNIDDITNNLIEILEEVKPCHLAYFFMFFYTFTNKEVFNTKLINRFFINFRGNIPLILDGTWLLNGENLLNGYEFYSEPIKVGSKNRIFISKKEIFKSTVRIEKNLWYLDGTYNLDGSKLLNAEVREEEL